MKYLVIKIYRPEKITPFGYWCLFNDIRRTVTTTMLRMFKGEYQTKFEGTCKVTIQLIDEKPDPAVSGKQQRRKR